MLDCNVNDLFDALEAVSLMDDYKFEKTRLKFENNGYILKRDKNGNVYINMTVEKKQYVYKDSVQKYIGSFPFIFVRVANGEPPIGIPWETFQTHM